MNYEDLLIFMTIPNAIKLLLIPLSVIIYVVVTTDNIRLKNDEKFEDKLIVIYNLLEKKGEVYLTHKEYFIFKDSNTISYEHYNVRMEQNGVLIKKINYKRA